MKTKLYLSILATLMPLFLLSQNITQVIRGTVVDKESKFPLIGVNVVVDLPAEAGKTTNIIGAITDENGQYRLEGVPLGRQTIRFSYLGYEDLTLSNIVLTSGKEVILNVEMEESAVSLTEVEVVARQSGEARNEMSTVSARQFSVEETERYAGSRGDPGRMASNFAGVQGSDDSRNDIIIRGNTPQGVLWRLEGVNIPNPNHFAVPGTGGGPVTILNNKYLANSDFFTGAFPAEYANGIAGVFDLRMRNGNNEKYEFSGQLGFLGTELMAEGPVSKEKRSSFLLSYRYSTLQLFGFLGINVGTDAIPQYQDAAFRLSFPTAKGGNIALWGIGGNSSINIVKSELEAPEANTDLYAENQVDQYFWSRMGVAGLTWTQPLNENTFSKLTLSAAHQGVGAYHKYIFRHVEDGKFVYDSIPPVLDYTFGTNTLSANFLINHKINSKTSLKAGLQTDYLSFNLIDSVRAVHQLPDQSFQLEPWRKRWDTQSSALKVQPFVQFKYKAGARWTLTGGITALYFNLNKNTFSPIEPRFGLSYKLSKNQKLNFGYGLHSQTMPYYLYYYGYETINGDPQEHNTQVGLLKSNHFVLGYDWYPAPKVRVKVETYYQNLFNIPVENKPSSFSIVNSGSGFFRLFPDTLVNEGTGRNYGLELTLERFFSGGYYFLLTTSLFDSKYRGSDGVLRNTTFNTRFATNLLASKEFTFKGGSALNIGGKLTYAGGRWYGPVDEEASAFEQEVIYIDETVNTLQFRPYFRLDAKISFRWNRPKVSHEFSIDMVNLTNHKNILTLTYVPDHPSGNPVQEEYQLGFLPIFYYKIDF